MAMLCYADDITTLSRIPTGERKKSTALINDDLERILKFGKKWLLEFETKKTKAITISKKRDTTNTPLIMDGEEILECDTLNVLGYTLDRKGTWKPHIELQQRQD